MEPKPDANPKSGSSGDRTYTDCTGTEITVEEATLHAIAGGEDADDEILRRYGYSKSEAAMIVTGVRDNSITEAQKDFIHALGFMGMQSERGETMSRERFVSRFQMFMQIERLAMSNIRG